MKILLLSAPFLPEYMRNARCDFVSLSATQWYPLLLGYCGAYLEGLGHDVKLIDAPADGITHAQCRVMIRAYKPDLFVLYTGTKSEANDFEFSDPLIEELGCDSVIAGPFASIDPEGTLARSRAINKLVTGEFEHPIGEIADGKKLSEIKNLLYKNSSDEFRGHDPGLKGEFRIPGTRSGIERRIPVMSPEFSRNAERPYLTGEQLDAIPFVSRFFRKHLDIHRYKTPSELYPFMDIMTGRGCKWGLCTYCLWVHTYIKGAVYNARSIPNVIEEFRAITAEMPEMRSVMIQDDTFTEDRAAEFCEEKIKAGIKIPWSCYARADMSYDALKLMKQSGCRNLHVGYESADPQVLKNVKKGLTVERMTKFTADANRAGLRIHGDFAFGFPGETPESAAKTISWACRMNPATAQFQLMIPFPGTPYHAMMREKGWLNADGQPDMPQFTNEQIRATAKKAYRAFYISRNYLWKCIRHPGDFFFARLKTISRAIPAMFWKKWDV